MARLWRAPRAAAVLRLAALVLLSILVVTPGVAYARTIALSSGSFAFEVAPGDSGEGEVIVMNDGDEPLKALVYIVDVKVDEAGQQSFEAPTREGGSILTTPASWFRIFMPADSKAVGNTPYLEMDPGERIPIRFDFTPPQGVAPGDHNVVIFFEMFEFAQGAEGAAAQVSGRLGTRIALRVTGEIVERLTIRPFVVPEFRIGGTVPFSFTLNNEGNTNKRVAVTAELLDRSERSVVASVVASDTAIFADSRYRFEGGLDAGAGAGRFGQHTVEVKALYHLEGAETPSELVERRAVWLVPLWVVLLAGFMVFNILLYLAVRVLRGRRLRPALVAVTDNRGPETVPPGERPARQATGPLPASPRAETVQAAEASRLGRQGRHMSRKELKAEAEERRRRREARAAEEAAQGGPRRERPQGLESDSPASGDSD